MQSYCRWPLHNALDFQKQSHLPRMPSHENDSQRRQIHKPLFPGTSNRQYSLRAACSQSKKFLFLYFHGSMYQLLHRALCKYSLLYAGFHLLIKLSIPSSIIRSQCTWFLLSISLLSMKPCQHLYRRRVIVGKEKAFFCIQFLDRCHIFLIQHKVKHIYVLDHAYFMC